MVTDNCNRQFHTITQCTCWSANVVVLIAFLTIKHNKFNIKDNFFCYNGCGFIENKNYSTEHRFVRCRRSYKLYAVSYESTMLTNHGPLITGPKSLVVSGRPTFKSHSRYLRSMGIVRKTHQKHFSKSRVLQTAKIWIKRKSIKLIIDFSHTLICSRKILKEKFFGKKIRVFIFKNKYV